MTGRPFLADPACPTCKGRGYRLALLTSGRQTAGVCAVVTLCGCVVHLPEGLTAPAAERPTEAPGPT